MTTAVAEPLAQVDLLIEQAEIGCYICHVCYPYAPALGEVLTTLCGRSEAWFEWDETLPDCPECIRVTACINGHDAWTS